MLGFQILQSNSSNSYQVFLTFNIFPTKIKNASNVMTCETKYPSSAKLTLILFVEIFRWIVTFFSKIAIQIFFQPLKAIDFILRILCSLIFVKRIIPQLDQFIFKSVHCLLDMLFQCF